MQLAPKAITWCEIAQKWRLWGHLVSFEITDFDTDRQPIFLSVNNTDLLSYLTPFWSFCGISVKWVMWLVATEFQKSAITKTDVLFGILLCNGRPSFRRQVWYCALSVR